MKDHPKVYYWKGRNIVEMTKEELMAAVIAMAQDLEAEQKRLERLMFEMVPLPKATTTP